MVKPNAELLRVDFGNDLVQIPPLEGRLPSDHYVEDNSKRPNIAALVVVLVQDFGSHVVGLAIYKTHTVPKD